MQNISDYMVYLLILLHGMMSVVARTRKITLWDIMAEADKFFHGRYIDKERDVKIANKTILNVSSDVDPSGVYTQKGTED